MNYLTIAWRNMRDRALASTLTGLSMALGVAAVICVLVIHRVAVEQFNQDPQGFNFIVGGTGGRTQLVLSTVYHLDKPLYPIKYHHYRKFIDGSYAPYCDLVVPYCLGDRLEAGGYKYRVVGTSPDFFKLKYNGEQSYQFAEGRPFKSENFYEAVVGSVVAAQSGLKVGDTINPTHGLAGEGDKHREFKIVGILAPSKTANDRAVFANYEGFYLLPGHSLTPPGEEKTAEQEEILALPPEPGAPTVGYDNDGNQLTPLPGVQREVTAILVLSNNPASAWALQTSINKATDGLQAVSPTEVVTGLLENIVGPVKVVLLVLTALIVLVRGSAHSPGEQVEPGVPAVLAMDDPVVDEPAADAESSGRRLALARWLVDEGNPLTSRVMANRLWQHHFGRGLVRNSNDFGLAGAPPTHPELLDWLASELIAVDWSLKEMHRRIMTSAAYRMSSADDARSRDVDPVNDLFWRFDMRRLTAEEVRDSILAVTGQLNRALGGPSIYTAIPDEVLSGASRPDLAWGESSPVDRKRRSVYIHVKRSLAEPVLKTFDSPDTETSCAVRFVTTVPTQSLTMLNGEFFHEQAAAFADRLEAEVDGVDQQVARALVLALSRTPTSDEITRGTSLIADWQSEDGLDARTALEYYCLLVLNLNEFVYLD